MSMIVMRMKPYKVLISVKPSETRGERGEGGLKELTEFILGAPKDSLLSRVDVEPDHRPDFPRLLVTRLHGGISRWGFELQLRLAEHEDVDASVAAVYALFAKSEWEAC